MKRPKAADIISNSGEWQFFLPFDPEEPTRIVDLMPGEPQTVWMWVYSCSYRCWMWRPEGEEEELD